MSITSSSYFKACAALLTVLVLVLFTSTFIGPGDPEYSPEGSAVPVTGFAPKTNLCSFDSNDQLSSFIWSHRAHWMVDGDSPRLVDGSKKALQNLLDAGITNFDVDITYYNNDFYVIHPAEYEVLKKKGESSEDFLSIQTLDSFLDQIESHAAIIKVLSASTLTSSSDHQSTRKHVFITTEPKFNVKDKDKDKDIDSFLLKKMVAILQKNTFRQLHTAVVAGGTALQMEVEGIMTTSEANKSELDLSQAQEWFGPRASQIKAAQTLMLMADMDAVEVIPGLKSRLHIAVPIKTMNVPTDQPAWAEFPHWFLTGQVTNSGPNIGQVTNNGANTNTDTGADTVSDKKGNTSGPNIGQVTNTAADTVIDKKGNTRKEQEQEQEQEHEHVHVQEQEQETGLEGLGVLRTSQSTVSDIGYGGGGAAGGLTCSDCCTVVPQYSRTFKQVVMVDVKLLQRHHKGADKQTVQELAQGSSFSSVCRRSRSTVLPWIVDSTELLGEMLHADVDGVVTNMPVKLLAELHKRFDRECR